MHLSPTANLLLANASLSPEAESSLCDWRRSAGIVEKIGQEVTSLKVGDGLQSVLETFTWSKKCLALADGFFVVPPPSMGEQPRAEH